MSRLGFLADAVPAIRHHHENFDGTGYPAGIAGMEIPLGARIIHVADALDAMMNARVYRPGRSLEGALDELRAKAGSQFCPRCVVAAVAVAERDAIGARDACCCELSHYRVCVGCPAFAGRHDSAGGLRIMATGKRRPSAHQTSWTELHREREVRALPLPNTPFPPHPLSTSS